MHILHAVLYTFFKMLMLIYIYIYKEFVQQLGVSLIIIFFILMTLMLDSEVIL